MVRGHVEVLGRGHVRVLAVAIVLHVVRVPVELLAERDELGGARR